MTTIGMLSRFRRTGYNLLGYGHQYERTSSTDLEDKSHGKGRVSPCDGSNSNSDDEGDSFGSPTRHVSVRRLEAGQRDGAAVPFLRPLRPEKRYRVNRIRVFACLLAGTAASLIVTWYRVSTKPLNTGSSESKEYTGASDYPEIVDSYGIATATSPSSPGFDETRLYSLTSDGHLQLYNQSNELVTEVQAVTDLLGLNVEVMDGDCAVSLELSAGASELYIPLRPDQSPTQPKNYPPLRPVHGLPEEQLRSWFLKGSFKKPHSPQAFPSDPQLDVIMTWVNGSDPLWQLGRTEKAEKHGLGSRIDSMTRHWRNNGMGSYPLRSIVDAFSSANETKHLRRIHVVTADMPIAGIGLQAVRKIDREGSNLTNDKPFDGKMEKPWTLGQVPSWLEQNALIPLLDERTLSHANGAELQWHYHSEVFKMPESSFRASTITDYEEKKTRQFWKDERAWQQQALPSFNSFAIEWQLGWLTGVNDISIHLNDDMLLLAPLSSADFYSVPFGSVLRLDSGFGLKVRPDLDPSKFSDAGEWGGLQHANHLLSQRFPKRPRHYLHHLPKTLSMPIVHEAMHMYPNDIALAATRSFRELSIGSGDIELGFMATHLRIERWREALLWTWAVGKMGSLSTEDAGRWGDSAREELRSLLGMQTLTGEASIVKQERDTLRDVASAFEAGSWEAPKSTSYRFSSMDGHLPPLHRAGQLREDVCGIDVHQCFGESFINGTDDVSADEMFKRLTFDQWRCGDCLINALVYQSGRKGLAAFFPSDDVVVEGATIDPKIAHLPLTREWRSTNFSLEAVTQGFSKPTTLNLQAYSMAMLSRYLYVLGDTPARFDTINSASQAKSLTRTLDQDRSIAFACFNDDARVNEEERISDVLHDWLSERFSGERMYWEKEDLAVAVNATIIV